MAVISGNTEVSQAIADCLYGALGVIAGSQGTMNNFVYGNDTYQNYETICGGAGAVHTHMTNTRMTDPEVIETRFPVRVEQFAIRRGALAWRRRDRAADAGFTDTDGAVIGQHGGALGLVTEHPADFNLGLGATVGG